MIYALGLSAICLAWLWPGHYYPYTAFQQDMISGAGIGLVALAVVVGRPRASLRVPVSAVFAVLLAAIPLVQWALGHVPFLSDALLPAVYLIGFAIAVVAAARLDTTQPPFATGLFACLAVGAIASVAIGLVQWLQLGPLPMIEHANRSDRMYANLTQPNQLASLIGLGIAAVWWAFEAGKIRGALAAAVLAYLGFGLVLTQSRAGWLFVAMFVAMWALYRRRLSLRTPASAVAIGVVMFAGLVLARAPIDALVHQDVASATIEIRTSEPYRLIHLKTLMDALQERPLAGYGWMQIAAAQQAGVLNHPPTFETMSAAHNQALDFLIWNGLPLGLLIVGAIVWWAVRRLRACKDRDAWGLFVALGVLTMHSMVELPAQYAYFLMPAALMVGVIEARTVPAALQGRLRLASGPYALIALAMAGVMAVVWDEYYQVEDAVRQVRLKNEARRVLQGSAPTVPDVKLLDAQREYVRLWLTEPHPSMTPEQIEWYRQVVTRFPSPGAMTRYAVVAALNGRGAEARRALELMCRMTQPRHCDYGRRVWGSAARQQPLIAAVAYPETPLRR